MSLNAQSQVRLNRVRCTCGRRAIYVRPHGHGIARRGDHDLCPACWRRMVDRSRPIRTRVLARVLTPVATAAAA